MNIFLPIVALLRGKHFANQITTQCAYTPQTDYIDYQRICKLINVWLGKHRCEIGSRLLIYLSTHETLRSISRLR